MTRDPSIQKGDTVVIEWNDTSAEPLTAKVRKVTAADLWLSLPGCIQGVQWTQIKSIRSTEVR
jgi:hypothetical protein